MYKIMTKLHVSRDNVYAYHKVLNDQGKMVEYESDDLEQAKQKALVVLRNVGYGDIRVVDEYLLEPNLIKPEEGKYMVTITGPEGFEATPTLFDDVEKNSTIVSVFTFPTVIDAFHLIIDGVEFKTGLPAWIDCVEINDRSYEMTFNGITQNHNIEVVVDDSIKAE